MLGWSAQKLGAQRETLIIVGAARWTACPCSLGLSTGPASDTGKGVSGVLRRAVAETTAQWGGPRSGGAVMAIMRVSPDPPISLSILPARSSVRPSSLPAYAWLPCAMWAIFFPTQPLACSGSTSSGFGRGGSVSGERAELSRLLAGPQFCSSGGRRW